MFLSKHSIFFDLLTYLSFHDSRGVKLHRPNVIGNKTEGDLLEFKEIGKDSKNISLDQITKIIKSIPSFNLIILP